MPRETFLTAVAARVAGIPFALSRRRAFQTPHKILILQPCCLSQVMLATPLLTAIAAAYPQARIDWAVTKWASGAIVGNPLLTELLLLDDEELRVGSDRPLRDLIQRLRAAHYDTVLVPSSASLLSYVAWQARISQRIGLSINGRGFAYTIPVEPPQAVTNGGARGLLLAKAAGVEEAVAGEVGMAFYPSDGDRTAVTRLLIEELDWLGDSPLVLIHPGGGENPVRSQSLLRWPIERFAVLANYLAHKYGAKILLLGTASEASLTREMTGMMAGSAADYAGRLSLSEIGALAEMADLYVGNDSGPAHVAAACGCQTLVIYGPTNPAYSQPYTLRDSVRPVWHDGARLAEERPFTWDIGVTVDEAKVAADELLRPLRDRGAGAAFLTNLGK